MFNLNNSEPLPLKSQLKTKEKVTMNYDKSATYSISTLTIQKGEQSALDKRGFTIVELIVVMAILGILAFMAIPAYSQIKDKAREVRAMEEIRGLEKSINAFTIDK